MSFIIRSRKYLSQMRNGDDFTNNVNDFTTNFVASPGGLTKAIVEVDFFNVFEVSSTNTIQGDNASNSITSTSDLRNTFRINDQITAQITPSAGGAAQNFVATVNSFTSDGLTMFFTISSGSLTGSYVEFDDGYIYVSTTINTLEYQYGLVENNDSESFFSMVDGQFQSWIVQNLTNSLTNGTWRGNILSGKEGSFQAINLGAQNDPQGRPTYRRVRIEHTFKNLPFWLEGYDENTIPDFAQGNNCLKHVWQLTARPSEVSPNGEIATENNNQGSTPWYNERLNGFLPKYEKNSILYVADSETVDGIKYGSETTVTCNIQPINGATFSTDINVIAKVAYLPSITEYAPTQSGLASTQEFDTIWSFESLSRKVGGSAVSGTIITDMTVVNDSAGTGIDVTMNVEFPTTVDPTRQFIIIFDVANTVLTNANTDLTPVLGDIKSFVYNPDIAGLTTVSNLRFHAEFMDIGDGKTDYKGWIGDRLTLTYDFNLETAKNARLQGMSVSQSAYNPTTGDLFNVETFNFNIDTNVVGTVQNITIDTDRGFNEASDSQFNAVKVTTGTLSGTLQGYSVQIGMRVPWQDWLELTDADAVFYDPSKQFNGLNKNMSNYSGENGYQAVAVIDMHVESNGIVTHYQFISNEMEIYNHNLEDDTPPEWIGTILTRDSDGVEIENSILQADEQTTIDGNWQNTSGAMGVTEAVSVISIEPVESSQSARVYASSLRGAGFNNALTVPTLTFGNPINTKSDTDPLSILPNVDYNIYMRLYPTTDVAPVKAKRVSGQPAILVDDIVFNGINNRVIIIMDNVTYETVGTSEIVWNRAANKVIQASASTFAANPAPSSGSTYTVRFNVATVATGSSVRVYFGSSAGETITTTGFKSFNLTSSGDNVLRFEFVGFGRIEGLQILSQGADLGFKTGSSTGNLKLISDD